VERLAPDGKAAIVMANGAADSANSQERQIREAMVTDGCVEALVSLPTTLFRGTGVPATIWLLSPPRTQRDKVLFVDASSAGHMVSRTLRELDESDIDEITRTVDNWRSGQSPRELGGNISSASASVSEIRERDFNLSPRTYQPQPHDLPTQDTAMPKIRQLLDRLDVEYAVAREKDSIAIDILKGLTP
jgi:type I restriction enzyme M protein